jgi:hypothetical protein
MFLCEQAFSDGSDKVWSSALNAAYALILAHGRTHLATILALAEGYLAKQDLRCVGVCACVYMCV